MSDLALPLAVVAFALSMFVLLDCFLLKRRRAYQADAFRRASEAILRGEDFHYQDHECRLDVTHHSPESATFEYNALPETHHMPSASAETTNPVDFDDVGDDGVDDD